MNTPHPGFSLSPPAPPPGLWACRRFQEELLLRGAPGLAGCRHIRHSISPEQPIPTPRSWMTALPWNLCVTSSRAAALVMRRRRGPREPALPAGPRSQARGWEPRQARLYFQVPGSVSQQLSLGQRKGTEGVGEAARPQPQALTSRWWKFPSFVEWKHCPPAPCPPLLPHPQMSDSEFFTGHAGD